MTKSLLAGVALAMGLAFGVAAPASATTISLTGPTTGTVGTPLSFTVNFGDPTFPFFMPEVFFLSAKISIGYDSPQPVFFMPPVMGGPQEVLWVPTNGDLSTFTGTLTATHAYTTPGTYHVVASYIMTALGFPLPVPYDTVTSSFLTVTIAPTVTPIPARFSPCASANPPVPPPMTSTSIALPSTRINYLGSSSISLFRVSWRSERKASLLSWRS